MLGTLLKPDYEKLIRDKDWKRLREAFTDLDPPDLAEVLEDFPVQDSALVFRILIMIMWLAPVGAFGAIAAVVGATGFQAIISMFTLMIAFYITCALFIVVILGGLLQVVTGVNIFKLMRYLAREYLLIFSTPSSPRHRSALSPMTRAASATASMACRSGITASSRG